MVHTPWFIQLTFKNKSNPLQEFLLRAKLFDPIRPPTIVVAYLCIHPYSRNFFSSNILKGKNHEKVLGEV